jgi:hypothetical protein
MRGLRLLALLGSVFVGACLFEISEPPLDGRPCDSARRCLPGYLCREGACRAVQVGASCTDGRCGPGICWTGLGEPAFCTYACAASAECPEGTRCAEGDPDHAGATICVPEAKLGTSVGEGLAGDPCSGPAECRSGICDPSGVCSDTCQDDRFCAAGGSTHFQCGVVATGGTVTARCREEDLDGGDQGDLCGGGMGSCALGMCMDDPSDPGSGLCADPCCSSADCPEDTYCWLGWEGWQPGAGLVRACYPAGGSRGPGGFGDPCTGDAECASLLCWPDPKDAKKRCTDTCCVDADCPTGYRCAPQLADIDGDGTKESYVPICVALP